MKVIICVKLRLLMENLPRECGDIDDRRGVEFCAGVVQRIRKYEAPFRVRVIHFNAHAIHGINDVSWLSGGRSGHVFRQRSHDHQIHPKRHISVKLFNHNIN
jgi:hypothetical protein